jgi:hypothetical protein
MAPEPIKNSTPRLLQEKILQDICIRRIVRPVVARAGHIVVATVDGQGWLARLSGPFRIQSQFWDIGTLSRPRALIATLCYNARMTYPEKITFGELRESGVREVLIPELHVTALLTELPPTRRQTRAAIAVVFMVIVAFAGVAPFSGRQAATLNAFFPSLDAIVLVTDLITAVLLYAQF